jgi:hypothetical protein
MPLSAWRIGDHGPERVRRTQIELEHSLEDWIEADPGLVENDLVIVGRQVVLDRGRLDLLGVDSSGRWVVVELKPGTLYQDVITQALGYVASLRELPPERLRSIAESYLAHRPNPDAISRLEAALSAGDDASPPEIRALVVGTSRDPGLDRLMDLLTDHDVAIEAISFEPFELPDGEIIMIREITEAPADTEADRASNSEKLNGVLEHAQENGVRSIFDDFLKIGAELGLPARAYAVTLMFTPPTNRTRGLLAIWADKGATWLDTSFETFEEFFPEVTADEARRQLGAEKRRQLDHESAARFQAGLKSLLG